MSTKTRGFASASKARRSELSAKGGRAAQEKGTGHSWSKEEATAAANKAAEKRKKRQAEAAVLFLLSEGYTSEELMRMSLSLDEFLYYGGAKSNKDRLMELALRLQTGNYHRTRLG